MLKILKSLNDNIVILNGKLKARGLFVEEEGKDTEEDMMEEDTTMEIIQSHMEWSYEKD